MGRFGSLMASTWRSSQSFTAWLVPHTSGPASSTPSTTSNQRPEKDWPEETTPQPYAHIGGNQVIGLRSSTAAGGAGRATGGVAGMEQAMQRKLPLTQFYVNGRLQLFRQFGTASCSSSPSPYRRSFT